MIDVLILDDSPTVRHGLRSVIELDPELQVVGEAASRENSVKMARTLEPGIIVADAHLAAEDGCELVLSIMEEAPCPIVALSAGSGDADPELTKTLKAAGVLMVMGKPTAASQDEGLIVELLRNVKVMAAVQVVRRRRRVVRRPDAPPAAATTVAASAPGQARLEVLAIGASTGGPPAIQTVLSGLPVGGPPVLVVQHISEGFVKGMVRWLGDTIPQEVKLAEDGEKLRRGVVYVAPDGHHLTLATRRIIRLSDDPPVGGHRPAVDVLFESVAQIHRSNAGALLLTGMGRDGAKGLLTVRQMEGRTLAQDEQSCVVFGMPGEAVARGAAQFICPLDGISDCVLNWLRDDSGSEVPR